MPSTTGTSALLPQFKGHEAASIIAKLDQNITAVEEEISKIQRKPEGQGNNHTETAVFELKHKRCEVARQRNGHVPLARLYPDIVYAILRALVDGVIACLSEDPFKNPETQLRRWVSATQFYSEWRYVALVMADLWTSVALSSNPWCTIFLERSKSQPLNVVLKTTDEKTDPLIGVMNRVQTIDVSFEFISWPTSNCISIMGFMPMLESLTIRAALPSSSFQRALGVQLPSAQCLPKLHTLVLRNCYVIRRSGISAATLGTPLSSIRRLDASAIVDGIIKAPYVFPNVENLILRPQCSQKFCVPHTSWMPMSATPHNLSIGPCCHNVAHRDHMLDPVILSNFTQILPQVVDIHFDMRQLFISHNRMSILRQFLRQFFEVHTTSPRSMHLTASYTRDDQAEVVLTVRDDRNAEVVVLRGIFGSYNSSEDGKNVAEITAMLQDVSGLDFQQLRLTSRKPRSITSFRKEEVFPSFMDIECLELDGRSSFIELSYFLRNSGYGHSRRKGRSRKCQPRKITDDSKFPNLSAIRVMGILDNPENVQYGGNATRVFLAFVRSKEVSGVQGIERVEFGGDGGLTALERFLGRDELRSLLNIVPNVIVNGEKISE